MNIRKHILNNSGDKINTKRKTFFSQEVLNNKTYIKLPLAYHIGQGASRMWALRQAPPIHWAGNRQAGGPPGILVAALMSFHLARPQA